MRRPKRASLSSYKSNIIILMPHMSAWMAITEALIKVKISKLQREINQALKEKKPLNLRKQNKINGLTFFLSLLNEYNEYKEPIQSYTFDQLIDIAKREHPQLLSGWFSETKELLYNLRTIYIHYFYMLREFIINDVNTSLKAQSLLTPPKNNQPYNTEDNCGDGQRQSR